MGDHLKAVDLGSIDEGRFMQQCNEAFAKLQEEMVKYADKHGTKAAKSKGTISITLQVICADAEAGAFGLFHQVKSTLPSPPVKGTIAMAGNREDDHPRLFCRPSGTGKDMPNQKVLCTENGDKVDLGTGEVLNHT